MNLNELRQKRGTLIKSCRDLLKKAEDEKRDLSTDEQTQYDKMFSESQSIGEQIIREDALRSAERTVEGSERVGHGVEHAASEPTAEQRYEKVVRPAISKWLSRGVSGMSADERRALQADLDVSGGYLKPPMQFIREIIKAVDNMLFIRQNATVHQITESDSLGAPSLDADPTDAAWTGEISAAAEDSAMAFGRRELKPSPLKRLLKVSNKLLRLAPDAEALVRDRLAYKVAVPQENAFLNGNGANQPLGVFVASALGISTGRDIPTDNEAEAVKAGNLIECKYALKGQYHPRARWIGHRDWVKRVAKLTDSMGQYLWQPGLQQGQPDRLLGFPVDMSEYAPSTFTTGKYVAILGDFSYYWIADVLAMEFKRLDELYATSSQTGFMIEMHSDGMPVLEEAFIRSKMG